ncbi:MAG: hypothetical protein DRP42_02735 [Tenericutes bacterium]|nr:MAG: hypothetical protein DRP42_02735 [Mycoplasmatota bacterium]
MKKVIDLYDSFPIKASIKEENKKFIFSDSGAVRDGTSLICSVAASHSGTLINNRVYPPDKMKKGIRSWTTPFKKPVLINHNEEGDPIGRVLKAKYTKTPRGMDGTEYKPILKPTEGYGYVDLTVKITDQAAIQKVLDGRYETVSVRMSTDKAICSLCDTDWADEGPCEHMPGKKYDGKLAYMTTGDLTYREVSFVNIPADEFAKVDGAIFEDKEDRDPVDVKVYANNTEEKFLCDLNDEGQTNLYDYLRDAYDEEEDTVVHLINKNIMEDRNSKEDQMLNEKDLTKDQLVEMDAVKELIQEAKDESIKECEDQLKTLKEECEKITKDSVDADMKQELADAEEKLNAAIDAQTALSKEKDTLTKERDELKEAQDKGDEEKTTILDENVSLNSELHKLNAERLFDLKSELKKPDVAGVKTIEDRDKKVEEFAQRSIESLKDQIGDLVIEKNDAPEAIKPAVEVENPGVEHEDSGKQKDEGDSKKETKTETLDRLFNSKKGDE